MNPRRRLARNLTAESSAYGYTLTIWGGGAVLMATYGTPSPPEVFAYVGGALVAFAALAVLAFGALFDDVDTSGHGRLLVTSMVHVFATLGNLAVSWALVTAAAASTLPAVGCFLLVGFQATFLYNVLLLVEEATARLVTAAKRRMTE